MKIAIALLAALVLSGCATDGFVRKEVVTETRYVTRTASAAQKQLPPLPPAINVETATQSDLAEWILQTERYILDLEGIIKQLIIFYEAKPTEAEKKAVEPKKAAEPEKK